MNYIKQLRIIGFKKFEDTTIKFNENLNIIVGENEAGKSTIIEAINIVLNQLYKNADKSIIKEMININNYNEFKQNPTIEKLPKICIEIELELDKNIKNLKFSGLEYDFEDDSGENAKNGIVFKCELNEELIDIAQKIVDKGNIPYECYSFKWYTFSGSVYNSMMKTVKYLNINTSNVETNNTYNYYNKSLFNNKITDVDKITAKENYNQGIEKLLNDEIFKIDDKRRFGINSKKVILENIINILEDEISIENKGSGMENFIKTEMALEKNSNNNIITIEEPENHLSYSNLRKMINEIENKEEFSQIIITTHSSRIVSNLNLKNVILINNALPINFTDIDDKVAKYFEKSDDNKLLEFILAHKVILVEGNTEYILLPKFYEKVNKEHIEKDNITVISASGLGYKNYIELAKLLHKDMAVITDNDKNIDKINEIKDFNKNESKIKIFTDNEINRWTIEVCIFYDNQDLLNEIIPVEADAKYYFNGENYGQVLGKMLNNKTETAMELLDKDIQVPQYIKGALQWIKELS